MDRDGGNRAQRIYRCRPIMPYQNSSWIMESKMYREERIQISLSSSAMIDPLTQDPG